MLNQRSLVFLQVIFLSILLSLSGCASLKLEKPISPSESSDFPKTIAVVAAKYPPESNFDVFASGYLEGAMKGAGKGMITGGGFGAYVGVSDPIAFLLMPYIVATGAIVGGLVGTGVGLYKAVPEERTEALERDLASSSEDLYFSTLMAHEVVNATHKFTPYYTKFIPDSGPYSAEDMPDYSNLNKDEFGGVIEIRVSKLIFKGSNGKDPDIYFFMTVVTHFVDSETGEVVTSRGLAYQSPSQPASIWLENDASLLKMEIERAYTVLAEAIVENFLLGENTFASKSVSPIYPPIQYKKSIFPYYKISPITSKVDTLKPVFKWGPFPSSNNKITENNKAEDVCYDLRIWKVKNGIPGNQIYERIGLDSTEHNLEIELEPSKEYMWSIRPRYKVNGKNLAAEWSGFSLISSIDEIDNDALQEAFFTKSVNGKLKRYSKSYYCFIIPRQYLLFMTPP